MGLGRIGRIDTKNPCNLTRSPMKDSPIATVSFSTHSRERKDLSAFKQYYGRATCDKRVRAGVWNPNARFPPRDAALLLAHALMHRMATMLTSPPLAFVAKLPHLTSPSCRRPSKLP